MLKAPLTTGTIQSRNHEPLSDIKQRNPVYDRVSLFYKE